PHGWPVDSGQARHEARGLLALGAVPPETHVSVERLDETNAVRLRALLDSGIAPGTQLHDVTVDAPADLVAFAAASGQRPSRRLADLIDANVDRLAEVECLDMAMLLRSLRARVIARGARNFRAYADLAASYQEREWSSNGTANRVVRRPAGPVVVITPWNAPF